MKKIIKNVLKASALIFILIMFLFFANESIKQGRIDLALIYVIFGALYCFIFYFMFYKEVTNG